MAMICVRKCRNKRQSHSSKIPPHDGRAYSGAPFSISHPIPSEESSYRTDFLLRRSRRSSSRSVLQRTRTRVKSMFDSSPKTIVQDSDKIPQLPVTPPPQLRRQPTTESIRVYTPRGEFVNMSSLKQGPHLSVGQHMAFTEMIDEVGFKNKQGDLSYKVLDSPELSKRGLQFPRNA
ncbi:hypothetical protein BBP40_002822 [Aspergillus hancockii]|nr:hypothetical protein BBP40_002822 [Aspergillus hancockii]